jgi:hypothetical protein
VSDTSVDLTPAQAWEQMEREKHAALLREMEHAQRYREHEMAQNDAERADVRRHRAYIEQSDAERVELLRREVQALEAIAGWLERLVREGGRR